MKIYQVIAKAKKEFLPIKKNAKNPFLKSKYADLDCIYNAINKTLENNGLLILQPIKCYELITQIIHLESGELIESNYPLPHLDDPQKMGSSITYARRYALCSFLNLLTDDDDDGNIASNKTTYNTSQIISDAQQKRLFAISKETGCSNEQSKEILKSFGYESSKEIQKKDYDLICNRIKNLVLI